MTDTASKLYAALVLALPYVERVAAMEPTEPGRIKRQRQAVVDLAIIQAAIAAAHDANVDTLKLATPGA